MGQIQIIFCLKNANDLYDFLKNVTLSVRYSTTTKNAVCYAKRINIVYPSDEPRLCDWLFLIT